MLRSVSWEYSPTLKQKKELFLGRIKLLEQFEKRFASFDEPDLQGIIASSSISGIGRRTYIIKCFRNTNIISKNSEPYSIVLERDSSIEDFIRRVNSLGLNEDHDISSLINRQMADKIDLACKLIEDFIKFREVLIISDNRCIVLNDGSMVEWFEKILQHFEQNKSVIFGIASDRRPHYSVLKKYPSFFHVAVPELEPNDRKILLKMYSEIEGLNLRNEHLKFFESVLSGLPSQIFFTVDIIKEYGYDLAKTKTVEIKEFGLNQVASVLNIYEGDADASAFLYLLSRSPYFLGELLFEVAPEEKYKSLLQDFHSKGLCEFFGSANEYVRLNDVVRDYITRLHYALREDFAKRLYSHTQSFLADYQSSERDESDVLWSIQELLKSGETIDENYLIPSNIIRAIADAYNERRYDAAVEFCDRILMKQDFLDQKVINSVRYYLCKSLARLANDRFHTEIKNINRNDADFLYGLFYRYKGDFKKAIEKFEPLAGKVSRAKRELAHVYNVVGDHEKALPLSEEVYRNDPNHPIHIQTYFTALLNSDSERKNNLLQELLMKLSSVPTPLGNEIYWNCSAQYCCHVQMDDAGAYRFIDKALDKYPNKIHPYLTALDVYKTFGNMGGLKTTVNKMKIIFDEKEEPLYYKIYEYESYVLADAGNVSGALRLVQGKLSKLPEQTISKIVKQIHDFSDKKSNQDMLPAAQAKWLTYGLHKGTIEKYNGSRGFGFIAGDEGENVFFHASNFLDGEENILPATLVSYELIKTIKGLHAEKIHIISKK